MTGLEHVLNGVAENGNGPAEDRASIHVHVVQSLGDEFRRRRQSATARGSAKQVAAAAVRAEAVREQPLVGPAASQQNRAGAVAKERIGLQIGGIEDA